MREIPLLFAVAAACIGHAAMAAGNDASLAQPRRSVMPVSVAAPVAHTREAVATRVHPLEATDPSRRASVAPPAGRGLDNASDGGYTYYQSGRR